MKPTAWLSPEGLLIPHNRFMALPKSAREGTPLYPRKEWQGLTPEDKRIAGIPLYTDQITMSDAFDVIEKILKEKNT